MNLKWRHLTPTLAVSAMAAEDDKLKLLSLSSAFGDFVLALSVTDCHTDLSFINRHLEPATGRPISFCHHWKFNPAYAECQWKSSERMNVCSHLL